MNIASNETHHVFTDAEVQAVRKKTKISCCIVPFVAFVLWVAVSFLIPSEASALMVLAGLIILTSSSLAVVFIAGTSSSLEPLSTKGFNSLRELSEANPSVAVWIAEALDDGRTLRLRDLWAAEAMDRRRQDVESQHQEEQAEKAAFLDLRDSARDSVMSRKTV